MARIESLKAELEALKAENAALKQQQQASAVTKAPTLRDRVSIDTLMRHELQYRFRQIGVAGWVRTCRLGGGGKFAFVKLFDGTTAQELQVLVDQSTPGFEHVGKSCTGASLFVVGAFVPSKGSQQSSELKAVNVELLGSCDAAKYPLSGKGISLEFLRSVAHLRSRSMVMGAVFRVRNALAYATHEFYRQGGYQYVHTPFITGSDCEGAGEMFAVSTLLKQGQVDSKEKGPNVYQDDFFKKPTFLTVSGQLNAEAMACGLSKVYTFGPTFRAEHSHTSRHLSEFWMIEPEIAFADLQEDMDIAESYIKFVLKYALSKQEHDLALLEKFEIGQQAERAKAEKLRQKELKAQRAKEAKARKAAKKKEEQAATQGGDAGNPKGDDKPATDKPKVDDSKTDDKPQDEQPKQQKQQQQQQKGKKQQQQQQKGKKQQQQQQKGKQKQQKGKAKQQKKPAKPWREIPLRERLQSVVSADFARVTYTEAITILEEAVAKGHPFEESKIDWGMDLGSEHERFLCEQHFRRPVIVYDYPKDIKSFYMRLNDDGKTVGAMDVLVPGVGELVGGSQREERLDVLTARIEEMGMDIKDYSWYLDLRRFGSVPHSGFGLGFGRLVCYTTGMDNIRDAIPFPRYPGHAEF